MRVRSKPLLSLGIALMVGATFVGSFAYYNGATASNPATYGVGDHAILVGEIRAAALDEESRFTKQCQNSGSCVTGILSIDDWTIEVGIPVEDWAGPGQVVIRGEVVHVDGEAQFMVILADSVHAPVTV